MLLKSKQVILAMVESTYGTDPTPTPSSDAILCNDDSSISPEGQEVTRNVYRETFSPQGHVVVGKKVNFTLNCELRGSGSVGVAPEISPLLQACSMAEEVVTDTEVNYTPTSDRTAMKSCTIYWYNDGILHKATGCRGTFTLNAAVNGIGSISFELQGLWQDPTDTAFPTDAAPLDLAPPVCESASLSVGGTSLVVNALELALNNQFADRPDLSAADGLKGIMITDRSTSGSLDPEVELLATFDPWTAWKTGTTAAISATIGTTAGNKVVTDVAAAQYNTPSYSDRDGIRTYDLPFVCTGTAAGDDEISLSFQ